MSGSVVQVPVPVTDESSQSEQWFERGMQMVSRLASERDELSADQLLSDDSDIKTLLDSGSFEDINIQFISSQLYG